MVINGLKFMILCKICSNKIECDTILCQKCGFPVHRYCAHLYYDVYYCLKCCENLKKYVYCNKCNKKMFKVEIYADVVYTCKKCSDEKDE